jgi:plastocyanin
MNLARAACALALLLGGGSALAASLEATVLSAAGKPVEDAAVVIEAVSGAYPKRQRTVTIEQRDREFIPYVTIVQTGTLVDFPNRDAFKHHIYSFSPAKVFEIKLYAGKPGQPVLFDQPGEVALGCNIHDWMEAYILVVNSAHFAKTDKDGRAVIPDVPPGSYRLRVWHPRQKAAAPLRDITLTAGPAPTRLNLVADVTVRAVKPKPPAESGHY